MDLVLLKMFGWHCRCCCRRFCSAYSSKTHSITKVNLPLFGAELRTMPKCVENADCSFAGSVCVCVFLLRRSIIISSLTTVKSVTCSFSFTHSIHRIHSPQLFIALLASARIVCCCCECVWVSECLIFFFWLCLSLSRVHSNMRNVKITAKWLSKY